MKKVFKIAVASGKGGTGKTTVSVNLFTKITEIYTSKTVLVDCDVEEPNDLIFFPQAAIKSTEKVFQTIPVINEEKCRFCRKCVSYCEFNAIVVIPPAKFAEINANMCHSCGACTFACEHGAITEVQNMIGNITNYDIGIGNGLTEGKLKIGSAMQTMVIKKMKPGINGENEIIIFDAPPGTSCPVVATVTDSDYILLVTEPTPFGLHDMKLMIDLLRKIEKPFGVIINKAGLGNLEVYDYLKKENIELLAEIPFDKDYAGKYASGNLLNNVPENISKIYVDLVNKIIARFNNV
ncbi:MAG: P-loop NTPase [Ignavibacteria bacterium]|nr:P-loop NTPase [Ignavibacteria bacterium]